jgi:hypothetical protein
MFDEENNDLGLDPELSDSSNLVGEEPQYRGECVCCGEPFEKGDVCFLCDRPVCSACITIDSETGDPICPDCNHSGDLVMV